MYLAIIFYHKKNFYLIKSLKLFTTFDETRIVRFLRWEALMSRWMNYAFHLLFQILKSRKGLWKNNSSIKAKVCIGNIWY